MSDQKARLDGHQRVIGGMLKQRSLDRERIAALDDRCSRLEQAILELDAMLRRAGFGVLDSPFSQESARQSTAEEAVTLRP